MIVLDTHAAIWFAGALKFRRAATTIIESALDGAGAAISAISAWEIRMLIAKKCLIVAGKAEHYVQNLFHHDGIVEEPVSATIALYAASLPPEFHGDAADRIIVATAAVLSVRSSRGMHRF